MTREEALWQWRQAPELCELLAKSLEIGSALKGTPSFVCPRCRAQSFNPHDIEHRYCGRCHMFIRSSAPLSQSTTHLGADPKQRPKRQEDAPWIEDGWSGKR
jgi:hypothetical protein